jgi:hypothetical protein
MAPVGHVPELLDDRRCCRKADGESHQADVCGHRQYEEPCEQYPDGEVERSVQLQRSLW